MTLMYLTIGFAPYVVMLAINFARNNKATKKNLATVIVFAITVLMFSINQASNSNNAVKSFDMNGVAKILTHYAINILWLIWPMILWWLLDFFARFTFDLYFLGLASIHFPTWILSIALMHTDPREALGWVVTPFLQTYMLVISISIYAFSKMIIIRRRKSGMEIISR